MAEAGVPDGALENGFRQICSVAKRVARVEDLAGYRMRVPAGRILSELLWSAFNLIGNLAFWNSLAEIEREVIHRAVRTHVARQRAWTVELNRVLEARLKRPASQPAMSRRSAAGIPDRRLRGCRTRRSSPRQ